MERRWTARRRPSRTKALLVHRVSKAERFHFLADLVEFLRILRLRDGAIDPGGDLRHVLVLSPRVVTEGVPIRMPLATKGFCGSNGIAFLLTVMPALSSAFSASAPVIFFGLKSTRNIWQSVPP